MNSTTLSPEHSRKALALAEAMLPGTSRIPGADRETVERARRLVGAVSPWAVSVFDGAVEVLDAAAIVTTGRRFHQLDGPRQQQLLEAWERVPGLHGLLFSVALSLKFVHFDREEVYHRLGGRLNVVAELERPRWLNGILEPD
ncbi:MAG: hypothetical protein HC923_07860, partial [Myxococcales bacterium]|nr:hypothetical protein [Myxococcales bacterium]